MTPCQLICIMSFFHSLSRLWICDCDINIDIYSCPITSDLIHENAQFKGAIDIFPASLYHNDLWVQRISEMTFIELIVIIEMRNSVLWLRFQRHNLGPSRWCFHGMSRVSTAVVFLSSFCFQPGESPCQQSALSSQTIITDRRGNEIIAEKYGSPVTPTTARRG